MKLRVNEIFYSIQGEGARAGCPSIFIRLSGCDLTCGFCDTEFESGREMTLNELYADLQQHPCNDIVWTGGEPALQLTEEIIQWFSDRAYYQCIETNGNNRVPSNLNFVSISPKVAEHVLAKNFKDEYTGVRELRYVRHSGQKALPQPQIKSDYKFLSPMFNGDQIDQKNVQHCMNLIMEDSSWRLSIQLHKILKVL